MDGISLLEASVLYSVLLAPLLSMVLLLFWASANMKNTAKAQLLGIVILLVMGFVAINSFISLIIGPIVFLLVVVWILANRDYLLEGQLSSTLRIFALQVAYYLLFLGLLVFEIKAITLLCIIPILTMILLYPWAFGKKNIFKGRLFIIIIFVVQVIFVILNLVLSFLAASNS